MSLNLKCPGCGMLFNVDDGAIPPGATSMACIRCQAKIPLTHREGAPSGCGIIAMVVQLLMVPALILGGLLFFRIL